MGKEGALALVQAFERWGFPSFLPQTLPASSPVLLHARCNDYFLPGAHDHIPVWIRREFPEWFWTRPLRFLSLGGWVEEGKKEEAPEETLLCALLFSAPCCALEVLRLNEQ